MRKEEFAAPGSREKARGQITSALSDACIFNFLVEMSETLVSMV